MAWVASLKIWQKFLLVGAVAAAMALPPAVMLVRAKVGEVTSAREELGGNAEMVAAREKVQAEAPAELAQATASAARDEDGPALGELQAEWDTIARVVGAREWQPPESFARHTALVARQLRWLEQVLDRSTLALDPAAATY